MTLIIVCAVFMLAEVQRASLGISQIDSEVTPICTNFLKGKRGRIEITLKATENKDVCPKAWLNASQSKRQ
ncbi:MAG: hypothetical protein EZS28_033549, partial [Streblomastix strix]